MFHNLLFLEATEIAKNATRSCDASTSTHLAVSLGLRMYTFFKKVSMKWRLGD